MDGLLINTEDMYTIALNEILKPHQKGPLNWDLKLQLQGLPGPEAGTKVLEHFELPITLEEYEAMNKKYQEELWPTCGFLPGAAELIGHLKSKGIPIALCTSSNSIKFESKTSHLKKTFDLFDVVITGDDPRIPKGRGKPFPDIWQLGLKELNRKFGTDIKHNDCLVFEDGIAGVKAGKSAGSYVIWVPHPEATNFLEDTESLLDGRGELLSSLEHLDKDKFGF